MAALTLENEQTLEGGLRLGFSASRKFNLVIPRPNLHYLCCSCMARNRKTDLPTRGVGVKEVSPLSPFEATDVPTGSGGAGGRSCRASGRQFAHGETASQEEEDILIRCWLSGKEIFVRLRDHALIISALCWVQTTCQT